LPFRENKYHMSNAFILSACRTPIGKFRGSLSWLPAVELGAIAVREAVSRAGVEPAAIEEVILATFFRPASARRLRGQAALRAGLSPKVAALTVNKVCELRTKSSEKHSLPRCTAVAMSIWSWLAAWKA